MLDSAHIGKSLSERRCLRCHVRLAPEEDLVCARDFPELYKGETNENEQRYLGYVLRPFPAATSDIANLQATQKEELSRFMLRVIRSQAVIEEYLHLYLFLFWDSIQWNDCEPIVLAEKYYKCDPGGSVSHFARNVLPIISIDRGAIFDIAGLAHNAMYVIELKHRELDDRGVGQLLRYFENAATVTELSDHKCDIRGVVPVLIASDVYVPQWAALPRYFRELLKVYYYKATDSALVLSDGKKRLRSLLKQRAVSAALAMPAQPRKCALTSGLRPDK